MKVWISPLTTVNELTGQKTQSTVYHLPGWGCINSNMVETDEETAKLFGRTLCRTCELRQEKVRLEQEIISDLDPEMLTRIGQLRPEFEVRVYFHPPGLNSSKKPHSPRRIWSSWDDKVVEES